MALFFPSHASARLTAAPPVQSRRPQPSINWVKLTDAEFFDGDSRPIMLFDGVFNLCNGGARFVRSNDRNRSYIKSEAVLKIMEYLDLPFPQLALFLSMVPLFIWDFVYDNIANNRYVTFG